MESESWSSWCCSGSADLKIGRGGLKFGIGGSVELKIGRSLEFIVNSVDVVIGRPTSLAVLFGVAAVIIVWLMDHRRRRRCSHCRSC